MTKVKTEDIKIRVASPADADSIAAVLHDAFVEYRRLYTPEGFSATAATVPAVLDRMKEGPVWIAALNQLIVGTVAAVPHGDSLYVRGMAILPGARGQGIGNKLLKHVEDHARASGFARMFLSTTPFLDRAIALYEHFGFRRIAEGPHDIFGTPLFTMQKELV